MWFWWGDRKSVKQNQRQIYWPWSVAPLALLKEWRNEGRNHLTAERNDHNMLLSFFYFVRIELVNMNWLISSRLREEVQCKLPKFRNCYNKGYRLKITSSDESVLLMNFQEWYPKNFTCLDLAPFNFIHVHYKKKKCISNGWNSLEISTIRQ